jgi:RNA-directed DNA polymerase
MLLFAPKARPDAQRIHKLCIGGMGVGEARSSGEVPIKSGWSEGALAGAKRTQRVLGADWGMSSSPTTGKLGAELTVKEALLPVKLRDWRAKLSVKAKQEKRFCFYSLYGLVSHPETLRAAWAQVRANGGAPGVDGVSIEQIEKEGEEAFLKELGRELAEKCYRTGAVRRVYIPKANGKKRPLGIPNLRDRVVQTAVVLILEPIFEADFLDCSYGYRPGRSAHDALEAIRLALVSGRTTIYDADMEGCFDAIPHDKLMACVRMRVVDGSVLRLIKQWLQAPVEEKDEKGRPKRRRNDKGTPQGGVISPLLANIYLHWFDRVFHSKEGPARWPRAVLVRYADDFVILTREAAEELMKFVEDKIERWLGLKLNREKTCLIHLREQGQAVDFLGYSFRLDRDLYGRKLRYWNMHPSSKALAREREKLREMINKSRCHRPLPDLIAELNQHLKAWSNYFRPGYSRDAFRQINGYVRLRLSRHLRRRSQRPWRPAEGTSVYGHLDQLGLIYL